MVISAANCGLSSTGDKSVEVVSYLITPIPMVSVTVVVNASELKEISYNSLLQRIRGHNYNDTCIMLKSLDKYSAIPALKKYTKGGEIGGQREKEGHIDGMNGKEQLKD